MRRPREAQFLSTARTHFCDVETTTTTTTTTSSLPPPTYRAAARRMKHLSVREKKSREREKETLTKRSSLSLDVFFMLLIKERSDNMCAYVLHQKANVKSIQSKRFDVLDNFHL